MTEVIGKCGISAKIVLDSVSAVTGSRLTTMEITYPRFILAEVNTHRMLSKNSASSRAIPFAKMQENLTAVPVRFGQANKGMQDTGVDYTMVVKHPETCYPLTPQEAWQAAGKSAQQWSQAFHQAGFHKQIFNRVSEAQQMMKTVVSATEWSNFFWLRDDEAADPSIAELARCMKQAYEQSVPQVLQAGEWHLPYVETTFEDIFGTGKKEDLVQCFWIDTGAITLEDAIKVSCARACAVSFRNTDYGLEKSKEVYERLISDSKIHGSALEHAAKVMGQATNMTCCDGSCYGWGTYEWEDGVSHMDAKGNLWSGNFKGFIQHRKTIKGENYENN